MPSAPTQIANKLLIFLSTGSARHGGSASGVDVEATYETMTVTGLGWTGTIAVNAYFGSRYDNSLQYYIAFSRKII
jgi:hypothetical protein